MNIQREHEETRKQLWCEVWIAVARSDSGLKIKVAHDWADAALKAFDERFTAPTKKEEVSN